MVLQRSVVKVESSSVDNYKKERLDLGLLRCLGVGYDREKVLKFLQGFFLGF